MSPSQILNIINFLKKESSPRWITSQAIKSKLNITDSSAAVIEKELLHFYNTNSNASIRYSTLPSKRNLNVLWGHVDKVGHRKLFDIFKEDNHIEADFLNNINDERNLFLSYSFKDTSKVFDLAKQLITLDLNPWIAEADIEMNSHINHDVIRAIEDLPFFGIYLSKHVLQSAWSAKEFGFATINKKKLFAFVDENDHDIINLIENNIPIDHCDIHALLRTLFDRSEFSEQIDFFLISTSEKNTHSYQRIKFLGQIKDVL